LVHVDDIYAAGRDGMSLTARRRSLGVREDHDTSLALFDEGLESGRGAVILLDFAAETVERDGLADLQLVGSAFVGILFSGRARGLLGGSAPGLGSGLLNFLGLGSRGGFRLGRLLGRRLRRRRRGLALAQFNGHSDGGESDAPEQVGREAQRNLHS
jgi:hypothetical protein